MAWRTFIYVFSFVLLLLIDLLPWLRQVDIVPRDEMIKQEGEGMSMGPGSSQQAGGGAGARSAAASAGGGAVPPMGEWREKM